MKITKTEGKGREVIYEYGKPGEGDWFRITIDLNDPGGGNIESNLKESPPKDRGDESYNAAVDGFESLLLALACEGFDLSNDFRVSAAVQTALDALANNFQ